MLKERILCPLTQLPPSSQPTASLNAPLIVIREINASTRFVCTTSIVLSIKVPEQTYDALMHRCGSKGYFTTVN